MTCFPHPGPHNVLCAMYYLSFANRSGKFPPCTLSWLPTGNGAKCLSMRLRLVCLLATLEETPGGYSTHTQDSLLSPTYVSMSQWERLAVQGTYTEDVVEGLEKVTCMSAASFGPVQTRRVLRPPG